MDTFSVKNFDRFQHYRDRNPPWIKLYFSLLQDLEYRKLPDASKSHLIAIYLLASRYENKIPWDLEGLKGLIGSTGKVDLDGLERVGFINRNKGDSTMLASRYQNARPEVETEGERETEKETTLAKIIPPWIKPELWDAFLEMRKRIRKPLTSYAEQLALKKLEKLRAAGEDPNAVLEQSISSSYQGLFPVKEEKSSGGFKTKYDLQKESLERMAKKHSLLEEEENERKRIDDAEPEGTSTDLATTRDWPGDS